MGKPVPKRTSLRSTDGPIRGMLGSEGAVDVGVKPSPSDLMVARGGLNPIGTPLPCDAGLRSDLMVQVGGAGAVGLGPTDRGGPLPSDLNMTSGGPEEDTRAAPSDTSL